MGVWNAPNGPAAASRECSSTVVAASSVPHPWLTRITIHSSSSDNRWSSIRWFALTGTPGEKSREAPLIDSVASFAVNHCCCWTEAQSSLYLWGCLGCSECQTIMCCDYSETCFSSQFPFSSVLWAGRPVRRVWAW